MNIFVFAVRLFTECVCICVCSRFASRPFADIHKVHGLRGIYIASQMVQNGTSRFEQVSLITYNKGAGWQDLSPPSRDSLGDRTNCSRFRWFQVGWQHQW